MGSQTKLQFPRINFSGLDLAKPGSHHWDLVRAQVMQALDSHGFFHAAFDDQVAADLADELFSLVAKELYHLPREAKLRNSSDKPYQGYIDRRPGFNYESLNIDDAPHLDSVQAFTKLMWPQGHPSFSNTVWRFAQRLSKLELMIRRMVLEGLGIEQYYDPHVESTRQTMRIAEYGAPEDQETMITIGAHADMNLVTIICQHQGEGLELLSKDGEWFHAPPKTLTVMFGESFEAWSNGRVQPTVHRVRMTSNETRYSIGFGSQFKDGYMVHAPEVLVDEQHPKLYHPYEYIAYLKFRFSEAGYKAKHALKTYCGVGVGGEEAAKHAVGFH